MLFNSFEFIFIYLPITFLVFFVLGGYSVRLAAAWLTAASLFFYGWWNPSYILLLAASIVFNYATGVFLAKAHDSGNSSHKSWILAIGISANLALLGYYKYANFFVANVNEALGTGLSIPPIILPIGISFFTFTQIAFLVDAARGLAREYDFIHYCLFVTYFPHLIAGPVLHHKEMMPQFAKPETYKINHDNIALGMSLFFFGLFKKLVLADNIACYSTPVFDAVAKGEAIGLLEAWGGALSYTLQLYFDFSGYTDMALGLSWLFGVKLPINFNSPYKANSIIDFWRRWHMTLSRFLRDYLYIPLGGNRKGKLHRHLNLLITMLLGGLWHGASWTYVAWGGLHGVYLILNHGWRALCMRLGLSQDNHSIFYKIFSRSLTFTAVVTAWVFFRSSTVDGAIVLLKGMAGLNGVHLPPKWADDALQNPIISWLIGHGATIRNDDVLFAGGSELRMIGLLLLLCWCMPNTNEIFMERGVAPQSVWHWRPSKTWAAVVIIIGYFSILSLSELSEFIYFQF